MANLDQLDKRIIQHLSEGISSYEELARECNVTRNTVYRRMTTLEKKGIMRKITHATINYDKLDIATINIALNVPQKNQEEILNSLKKHNNIKFLYKTYGSHNVIIIALCDKGREGQTINEIKAIIEKFNIFQINISVSFSSIKMDFTPFADETEPGNQTKDNQAVIRNIKDEVLIDI